MQNDTGMTDGEPDMRTHFSADDARVERLDKGMTLGGYNGFSYAVADEARALEVLHAVRAKHDASALMHTSEHSIIAAMLAFRETSVAAREGDDHGLGPHATVIEDADGFMSVAVLVGSNVYLKQGGAQLTVSREQFAEIAKMSATPPAQPAGREALFDQLRKAWFDGRRSPTDYDSEAVEAGWSRQIDALALTPPAPDVRPDTVAFVQEWMMSGDHDPTQWDRDFAAAIDARCAPDVRALREAIRNEIVNTPETADFMAGVPIEAIHQRERWGSCHDADKTPFDWFWLVGYLAQKAASSAVAGDMKKAQHHTISTAAALANWHAQINGHTDMRPGIGPNNGGEKPGSAFNLASKIDPALARGEKA